MIANPQSASFLLIDDDWVDVMAVRRAFAKAKIANPMHVAKDGIAALEMLRGTDATPAIPGPTVVLLDLNMPRMNGLAFLEELRRDAGLRDTIVFVFTTSKDESQKVAAYNHNVAGYIVKSEMTADFRQLASMLDTYWRVAEQP